MDKAVIIPTGKEILDGTVLDTDSPMICEKLGCLYPALAISVTRPVEDYEDEICSKVQEAASQGADLVILIGGSGGGHRYSATLANDYTHSGLERILEQKSTTSLYGKNGHLWSRLVCGTLGKAIVFNVPGPFREAERAMDAVCRIGTINACRIEQMNHDMAEAVKTCYGNERNIHDYGASI